MATNINRLKWSQEVLHQGSSEAQAMLAYSVLLTSSIRSLWLQSENAADSNARSVCSTSSARSETNTSMSQFRFFYTCTIVFKLLI